MLASVKSRRDQQHGNTRSIESRDDEICFEAIYRVYLSPLIRNVRACGLSAELDGNPLFFVSKGGDEEKKKKERRSFFFLVSFSGRKFVGFETNLLKIFPKFSRTNVSLLSPFHFHLSPDLRVENLGRGGRKEVNERINILDNPKLVRAREDTHVKFAGR